MVGAYSADRSLHYQVKCPPLDSVQVVGKASDALSRPIPRWAFLQRLQKIYCPDPYVLRWLPLAVANGRQPHPPKRISMHTVQQSSQYLPSSCAGSSSSDHEAVDADFRDPG